MSSKYSLRIVHLGQTQAPYDLQPRAGKDGRALVLQAQSGMRFQLLEVLTQVSPTKLRIARKGADLLLTLPEGESSTPDVVIKGYFDAQDVVLMGRSASGEWRAYDNTAGASAFSANSISAASIPDEQISTATLSASMGSGWFDGEKGWMWIGAGTLALVAGAAGVGGKSDDEPSAADKIKAYATREPNAATPTVADYDKAGVKGVAANNLAAMNSALTTTPLDMSVIENVQKVVDSYIRILGESNGSSPDATPGVDPSAEDFQNLGVLLGSQQGNANALALLNDAIKRLNSESCDTVTELRSIVTAVNKVMAIAAGVAPNSALTADDLLLMGLSQQQLDAVKAGDNLSAIVSAIGETSDDGAEVSSVAQLQTLMAAYNRILTETNGSAADADVVSNPTAADFAAIKANIGQAGSSATALTMLNDVVGGLQRADVDTVAEINALAATLDKLAVIAARESGDTNAPTLTATELSKLGLSGFSSTGSNNQAVADLLSTAIRDLEPSGVDTLAEVQALVSLQVLRVWARDAAVTKTAATPTVEDYARLGVQRFDTAGTEVVLSAADLVALNGFADNLADTRIDSQSEVQQLASALFRVLNEANGAGVDGNAAVNSTAADYVTLGVAGHAGAAADALHASAARLLTDVVSTKTSAQVDTPTELNALAASVDRVMDVAAGGAVSTLALNDLSLLGITGATATNLTAIGNLIQASADDGSAVDTLAELQALVNSARNLSVLGKTESANDAEGLSAIVDQVAQLAPADQTKGSPNASADKAGQANGFSAVAQDALVAHDSHQALHGDHPGLSPGELNQLQAFANATQVIIS
jgi:hypothetical protein